MLVCCNFGTSTIEVRSCFSSAPVLHWRWFKVPILTRNSCQSIHTVGVNWEGVTSAWSSPTRFRLINFFLSFRPVRDFTPKPVLTSVSIAFRSPFQVRSPASFKLILYLSGSRCFPTNLFFVWTSKSSLMSFHFETQTNKNLPMWKLVQNALLRQTDVALSCASCY